MAAMERAGFLGLLLAVAAGLGLAACGGGGSALPAPAITIEVPTAAPSYATTSTSVRLGGSIAQASFVHVTNTTTGATVEGYVNYLDGVGSWFADVYGLLPGDNLIVATADADGTGTRTASDTLTVTRPLRPASLILNAADAASASNHWADTSSFGTQAGSSHLIALYADGTGRATTGNVLTELPGPLADFSWAYDGPEAIVVSNCPSCSFQRISRISGSLGEGFFYGEVQTVGGAGETALHYFQLTVGKL